MKYRLKKKYNSGRKDRYWMTVILGLGWFLREDVSSLSWIFVQLQLVRGPKEDRRTS